MNRTARITIMVVVGLAVVVAVVGAVFAAIAVNIALGLVVFVAILCAVCVPFVDSPAVRELFTPQQEAPKPEPAKPEPVPQIIEPSPLAQMDPDMGWQHWFQGCVTTAKGARLPAGEAFSHYEAWAALNNVTRTLPLHLFGKRMTEGVKALGGDVKSSNGRFYMGVSLAPLSGGTPVVEAAE